MGGVGGFRHSTARAGFLALAVLFSTLVVGLPTSQAQADWVREDQWQLAELHATEAWRWSSGTGIRVAVIDSGVDGSHPDLAGQVLPGIDLVGGAPDGLTDPVGHGTTVAALIAGRSDDEVGVSGLAPGAQIIPIRVLDGRNRYDDASVIARGIRWAVNQGASVINLSLGGAEESEELREAIRYAMTSDVVVVACTGNREGPASGVWYPAREPGVVAVTGLGHSGGNGHSQSVPEGLRAEPTLDDRLPGAGPTLWEDSITGPQTVLSAPAVDLLGATPGGYWWVRGTSFAAPLVTATVALIRARWPEMNALNVINRLIRGAKDLGTPGRDERYGFGEVDPVASLTAPIADVAINPLTGSDTLQELPVTPRDNPEQPVIGAADPGKRNWNRLVRRPFGIILLTVGFLMLIWRYGFPAPRRPPLLSERPGRRFPLPAPGRCPIPERRSNAAVRCHRLVGFGSGPRDARHLSGCHGKPRLPVVGGRSEDDPEHLAPIAQQRPPGIAVSD